MRAVLILLLLAFGGASARGEDKVEWWTDNGGKALFNGVRDSSVAGLKAYCGETGYDVVLLFPGQYPGRWRHGQTASASVRSGGRELGKVTGALIDNSGESEWLLEAKVGDDHPLFQRLFSGESVRIGTGRESFALDGRAGRTALASFRSACTAR